MSTTSAIDMFNWPQQKGAHDKGCSATHTHTYIGEFGVNEINVKY